MTNALTEEARRQQQAKNEYVARQDAAAALGAIFKWATSASRAFPENVAVQLRQAGATLRLQYDEHDAVLVLGLCTADGKRHVLHAVSADLQSADTFGRPLDAILRAALDAAPLDAKPPISH
jgi:hypothetical protein